MNISLLTTLILTSFLCVPLFCCEKQPSNLSFIPFTQEQKDARAERVAVVRKIMTEEGVPQDKLTDVQADVLFFKVFKDALRDECKVQ